MAIGADLDHDCIEMQDRKYRIERSLLEGPQFGQDSVGDLRDQFWGHLHLVDLLKMARVSRVVILRATRETTRSLNPERHRRCFGISNGSNVAFRSRGISTPTVPASVWTVLS